LSWLVKDFVVKGLGIINRNSTQFQSEFYWSVFNSLVFLFLFTGINSLYATPIGASPLNTDNVSRLKNGKSSNIAMWSSLQVLVRKNQPFI
jgi:hypothetical protein